MNFKSVLTFWLVFAISFCQAKKSTEVTGNFIEAFRNISESNNLGGVKEKIKTQLRRFMGSKATFTPWPGFHEEIYDIDDEYSQIEPEVAEKNIDATLILEGVMNEDRNVDQLHVDVYWNGNLFHTEVHKFDDDVEEQEPYELRFVWFVPGFAPSGSYNVDLQVNSAGEELGCERCSFLL